MKSVLRRFWVLLPLQQRWRIKRLGHMGYERYCPVCESHVAQFLTAGLHDKRPDAKCPVCGSLERHRLAWSFLQTRIANSNKSPVSLLHFAPETCLEARFRMLRNVEYITADIDNPNTTIRLDITAIQLPDACLDCIFCSHVLEHVSDDRSAMREIRRVLKPGGWAVLQVPIKGDLTFEDSLITDPQSRLHLFGQEDHVRVYGRDFADRLREAGFTVEEWSAAKVVGEGNVALFGLKNEVLFYCH